VIKKFLVPVLNDGGLVLPLFRHAVAWPGRPDGVRWKVGAGQVSGA